MNKEGIHVSFYEDKIKTNSKTSNITFIFLFWFDFFDFCKYHIPYSQHLPTPFLLFVCPLLAFIFMFFWEVSTGVYVQSFKYRFESIIKTRYRYVKKRHKLNSKQWHGPGRETKETKKGRSFQQQKKAARAFRCGWIDAF